MAESTRKLEVESEKNREFAVKIRELEGQAEQLKSDISETQAKLQEANKVQPI